MVTARCPRSPRAPGRGHPPRRYASARRGRPARSTGACRPRKRPPRACRPRSRRCPRRGASRPSGCRRPSGSHPSPPRRRSRRCRDQGARQAGSRPRTCSAR
ncbi:MAG: hypothetical protein E6I65_03855 [Chloroflexi bacterium]|nr:MAG: hypothetical protein E6I65_03855 [Chloroflexota bacterium]